MSDNVTTSLGLMRRMPPNKVEQSLNGLMNLLPDDQDELLQRIDQPLEEASDPVNGRKFLQCDYNRDGDSYRSPWSNKYTPELDDGFLPSDKLRKMEVEANSLFDTYRELYYEGGVSSVYLFDLDVGAGFAGAFLIKKGVDSGDKFVKNGSWNSIHVIELTTTVMLDMAMDNDEVGKTNNHVVNMGRMVEDMEIYLRTNMHELYIKKTGEVVSNIRKAYKGPKDAQSNAFTNNLAAAVSTIKKVED
eukprot:GSChrysophyteH1.ASY1.ANO1.2193.1 assembled CDS